MNRYGKIDTILSNQATTRKDMCENMPKKQTCTEVLDTNLDWVCDREKVESLELRSTLGSVLTLVFVMCIFFCFLLALES